MCNTADATDRRLHHFIRPYVLDARVEAGLTSWPSSARSFHALSSLLCCQPAFGQASSCGAAVRVAGAWTLLDFLSRAGWALAETRRAPLPAASASCWRS